MTARFGARPVSKRFARVVAGLAASLLLLLASCAPAVAGPRLLLDSGWSWAPDAGDDKPGLFSPLSNDELADLTKLLPSGSGRLWLRRDFAVPSELAGRDLACFLGRITMADRSYLNGYFIGGRGRFPPAEFSAWNEARAYLLPAKALDQRGPNTLLIEVWIDHEGSLVGRPFIGTPDAVESKASSETFWNQTVNILSSTIMLFVAFYYLLLYFRRRQERENLFFALINLFSIVYLSNFYLSLVPGLPWPGMSFVIFQKIVANGMLYVLLFLLTSFVAAFLGIRQRLPVRIVRWALLAAPLLLVFLAPDYGTLREHRLFLQTFLLPPLGYIVFMAVFSLAKGNRDALALAAGLIPLVVAALLDIVVHEVLRLFDMPYLAGLGWPLVIASIFFILARRLSTTMSAVEELNADLERKVAERTRELSLANSELTTANELLEDARFSAERDMKMAAHVQRCFYPRAAVRCEGWDLAFHFAPMSGVSGDIFDFYVRDGILRGLGLFDVSGHGIASGLVAMLAKSIVHRKFVDNPDRSLAEIMVAINKDIIDEKGDIENYLTGVLLRFADDRVEYVNAAHPPMLFRRRKTGVIGALNVKGSDREGRFLGLEAVAGDYRSLSFSVDRGDVLLVYSDCLAEAKNPAGEEFGMGRIGEALRKAAHWNSAEEIRDGILSAFSDFVGAAPLKDDLTFIVLMRKG